MQPHRLFYPAYASLITAHSPNELKKVKIYVKNRRLSAAYVTGNAERV